MRPPIISMIGASELLATAAEHHENGLHVFCTSRRSMFMPRSSVTCRLLFPAVGQKSLIVRLSLVGAVGIEPTTSPV
jgi:hypothetical protein